MTPLRLQITDTAEERNNDAITDRDQDGQPDTLRFLSIHHAAARLLWEEPRPEQDEE